MAVVVIADNHIGHLQQLAADRHAVRFVTTGAGKRAAADRGVQPGAATAGSEDSDVLGHVEGYSSSKGA